MRLSKLKLAGFKSFVDPTTVHLPSNLTGVVGPNGCGKSNIIDAVRWVMGEISAKHLRGNDMTDVIFSGAAGRKPVGTASVELIFDNSDGSLTGPYAAYAEVSLKRQVSRDGQSTYFINGAKCRRKDITQLFLGTGLGSRSYAIIEQGMISRLIEAKPDDLRAFLEEAAGISKYKERRKETESRIAHTRENLDRLNDIREELDKQLKHLQRQAVTARRYQGLKEEERKLKAELLALRLRDLDSESGTRTAAVTSAELALEAAIAHLRGAEAAIEKGRERHTRETEVLSQVQGRYYQAGAEAARCEQAIAHAKELRARQRTDLDSANATYNETASLYARDAAEHATLSAALAALEPELATARAAETAARARLSAAEEAMQGFQVRWEAFTREGAEANQKAMVERARIEQLDGRLQRSLQQQERVHTERDNLAAQDVTAALADLQAKRDAAQQESEAAQVRVQGLIKEYNAARDAERLAQTALDKARSDLSRVRGQVVSLEAMQQAALGQVKGQVVEWLKGRALADKPRLAQGLTVESGWARAVETVLGSYLEAVCVDGLDAVAAIVGDLKVGQVTFIGGGTTVAAHAGAAGRLRAKVQGPAVLDELLGAVLAVDTLSDALAQRSALRDGESIITKDGVWIGRDWLRVSRDRDAHAGVLEREQELRTLKEQVKDAETQLTARDAALVHAREQIKALDRAREETQAEANRTHRQFVDLRSQHDSLRARAQQNAERLERLGRESAELAREIATAEEEGRQARSRLAVAVEAMHAAELRRPDLDAERSTLRGDLDGARSSAETARRVAQQAEIAVESRRSSLQSLTTSLARLVAQRDQIAARRAQLEQELQEGVAPLATLTSELEQLLAVRLGSEQALARQRVVVEAAEGEFQTLDHARLTAEQRVESSRAAASQAQLAAQETRVRRESLNEQFAATRFDLVQVTEALPEGSNVAAWETQVTEIEGKIERLGQVNLAAIDEFKEQSERKEYLDKQFADLTEALNSLESAIRKIDRETRERFQDTFDKVNAGLQSKFPRLFGGGNAYLELTGDDLLESGVAVMARPPGKRNSTISQLSGGEKALTAVALVFSIFELNPAPFCLLDEVDAPLDEHNVGRFCDIVREMSERVQFVFISHNKNTLELASQLVGVTMNEPGVSRLVSVDVDEALRLAAAG